MKFIIICLGVLLFKLSLLSEMKEVNRDDIIRAEHNSTKQIEVIKYLDSISNSKPQSTVDLVSNSFDIIENPEYLFQLRFSRVKAYIKLKQEKKAFREMYTLQHFCRLNELKQDLIKLNIYMINVLQDFRSIPESKRMCEELLDLVDTDTLKAYIYKELMYNNFGLDEMDKAIEHAYKVLDFNNVIDTSNYHIMAYLILAKSYLSIEKLDSTKKYLNILNDFYLNNQNEYFRYEINSLTVELKLRDGNTIGVKSALNEMETYYRKSNLKSDKDKIARQKMTYYQLINNKDSSEFYKDQAKDLLIEFNSSKKRLQLKKIKAEVDEAFYKREIKESNTKIYVISIGFVILLITSILLYIRSNKRKQHVNFLEEILSERENQEQYLNEELVQKDKDIEDLAAKMINKNKLLAELELKLDKESAKSDKEKEEDINNFKKEIDLSSLNNELYEKLLSVSEEFNSSLVKKYPLLSATELKVCALIKTGFSSKEIASMMYLSYRTIENHRNSIRKKTRLKKDVKLNSFLMSL